MRLLFILLISFSCFGQRQMLLQKIDTAPTSSLLLDNYPNALAAFSLRYLNSSYTGDVVLVRRNSDDAELGFTPTEITDGTLVGWVGAGNSGFVKTWYDQSGNSNDITQTGTTRQPRIVENAVLETDNGQVALAWGALNEFDFSVLTVTSDHLIAAVFNVINDTQFDSVIYNFNTGANVCTLGIAVTGEADLANSGQATTNNTSIAYTKGNQALTVAQVSPSNRFELNGVLATGGLNPRRSSAVNKIGSRDGAYYLEGFMQEFIIWDTDRWGDRLGIQTNINSYYSIY
jgi:hypothetical protein